MREYVVTAENQTVANASGDIDLVELDAATDKPIAILGFEIDQVGVADIGDAQEEFLRLAIVRGHTTSGSGGSSFTPLPMNPNDTAAGAAAEIHNTTVASAGTGVNLWAGSVGVRTPGPVVFGDSRNLDLCPKTSGTSLIVVRLMAAVADDITMSWTLWFVELI